MPDRLRWVGAGNLYARIGTYLRPTGSAGDRVSLWEFAAWSQAAAVSEFGSRPTTANVWAAPSGDPARALADGERPAVAFRPAIDPAALATPPAAGSGPPERLAGAFGARRGPGGVIEPAPTGRPAGPAVAATDRGSPMPEAPATAEAVGDGPMVMAPAAGDRPADPRIAELTGFDTRRMPPPPGEAPPRRNEPVEAEGYPLADRTFELRRPEDRRPAVADEPAAPSTATAEAVPADRPIRTTAELLDRLAMVGTKGAALRLADDAVLVLDDLAIAGTGRVDLVAAGDGPSRPRLLLVDRPPSRAESAEPTATVRVARRGSLLLRGIDVEVPETEDAGSAAPRLIRAGRRGDARAGGLHGDGPGRRDLGGRPPDRQGRRRGRRPRAPGGGGGDARAGGRPAPRQPRPLRRRRGRRRAGGLSRRWSSTTSSSPAAAASSTAAAGRGRSTTRRPGSTSGSGW